METLKQYLTIVFKPLKIFTFKKYIILRLEDAFYIDLFLSDYQFNYFLYFKDGQHYVILKQDDKERLKICLKNFRQVLGRDL